MSVKHRPAATTQPVRLFCCIVFTIMLTACSSSDDSTAPATTDDNNDPTAPDAGDTAPVQIRSTNLGEIYTDNAGLSLYTFNSDSQGVSNCNDGCAIAWPPFLAADDAVESGRFSIVSRAADGSRQWALDGWPLYYWQNDMLPGDTLGEEVNQLWYVAQPVPVSKWSAQVTTSGVDNTVTVLTDVQRRTLYVFPNDRNAPGSSACNDECASAWPPLFAAAGDSASGDYTIVTRDDGKLQWVYRGMPLYLWASDTIPGDTTGEDVNDVWYVAQPLPISKFSTTTQGVVITDNNWKTLYTLGGESDTSLVCTDACLTAWPPLLADEGEPDRGDFTTFQNSAGARQWAYKNQPLYFWTDDANVGDTNGHGLPHGSGAVWSVASP